MLPAAADRGQLSARTACLWLGETGHRRRGGGREGAPLAGANLANLLKETRFDVWVSSALKLGIGGSVSFLYESKKIKCRIGIGLVSIFSQALLGAV